MRYRLPLSSLFLLAIGCTALVLVFVLHVWTVQPFEVRRREPRRPPVVSALVEPPAETGLSALSRLTLFPHWSAQQTLFAVVIENHLDARPYQRGLDRSVLIAEFFVEGMISRFVALFDAAHPPAQIGPVRSLRPYLVEAVEPWISTILHAGGSPEALERVRKNKEIHAFNGLMLGDHFIRDPSVPAPHNLFLFRRGITDLTMQVEGRRVSAWPPYRTGSAPSGPSVSVIRINFFNPVHNVTYTFEPLQGTYARDSGSVRSGAHPRNVLILAMPITAIGEFGRLTIDTVGSGPAILFRLGRAYQGTWSRDDAMEPFTFVDGDGDPLVFSVGQTWMTVVEDLERVTWDDGNES